MKPKLFKETVKPRQTGYFMGGREDDMSSYATAYFDAALELAGNHPKGDIWALPVVFLFRHALELKAKEILFDHGRRTAVSPTKVVGRSHNLATQIADLRKVAATYHTAISNELVELLTAFEDADPLGMRSRFPRGKRLEPTPLIATDHAFDLQDVVERCQAAFNELDELRADIMREDARDIEREEISN